VHVAPLLRVHVAAEVGRKQSRPWWHLRPRQLLMEVRTEVSWGRTSVGACGADEMVRSYDGDPRGGGRLAMRSLTL
jgi:hypothetical protein